MEFEKLLAALGPVGGARNAAGPRGGDRARVGVRARGGDRTRGGERARGGDLRGVWVLGVMVRTGMAFASLKPAGERGRDECRRERLSRLSKPRDIGRGVETRDREFERDVIADATADSRSRGGDGRL